LRVENFGSIHLRAGDTLAETGDFTDLLEEDYLARSITVDANAGGIVTTIFLTGETVAEDITNLLAILANNKTQSTALSEGEASSYPCRGGRHGVEGRSHQP
jgi:hypothetical protein